MFRAFDFKCKNGHVEERFVKPGTKEVECRICGEPSSKQLCAPRSWTEETNGTSSDNWVKKRQKQIAHERKVNS